VNLDWLSIGQVLVKYSILNWVSILGKYPPFTGGYTLPDIRYPDRGLEYLTSTRFLWYELGMAVMEAVEEL